jgi:RNA polymerase sigma factor (TIGR02999 family)
LTLQNETTSLLAAARGGDRGALDRVFAIVYEELRRIAHRELGGWRTARTLGTTALVNEAYLKLVDRSRIVPDDRRHFLATAARAMRQIIVDYARMSHAAKRGGGERPISLGDVDAALEPGAIEIQERAASILALHGALSRLSERSARLGQVVELRFFGGFSVEEVADMLDVSPRTIKRDWRVARAFLHHELQGSESL